MQKWVRTTTMLIALCATSVVAAQMPPKAEVPDVIVTARRVEEQKREARDFVRSLSATPVNGQFARWHTPLCPMVSGVAANIAARVSDRIRAAALAAGAPIGKAGCKANAIVVFTPSAHALLAAMERREPLLLHDLPLPDARALRASSAPVIWWYGTLTEGADGSQLQSTPSAAFGANGTGNSPVPQNDQTRYLDSYRSSLISSPTRVAIQCAVVLVDVPLSRGRRLDAVADYAAFAILARVRSNAPQGTAPTILKLFTAEEADRPATLTDPDRAYLTALYTVAPDRSATVQAARIIDAVKGR
ncbi:MULTISPECIES: hypothetical protein [unclassified Sphingomonas]|uniref:hypothetical protein n=1 Tax=unclassified Sphingomonas TaxID=196159 RepID=UPI002269B6BB|nr:MULTISPECIES: hypothetical protein [unclassified Sphingomonas]